MCNRHLALRTTRYWKDTSEGCRQRSPVKFHLDQRAGTSEQVRRRVKHSVRAVFSKARENALVFFNAIAAERGRGGGDSGRGERVVSQLLT